MRPFKIKENPLIPYNYNLNKVLLNKGRAIQVLSQRIEYSNEYNGNFITRRQNKQVSNL